MGQNSGRLLGDKEFDDLLETFDRFTKAKMPKPEVKIVPKPRQGLIITRKDPSRPIPIRESYEGKLWSAIFQDKNKKWWAVDSRDEIAGKLGVQFPDEERGYGRKKMKIKSPPTNKMVKAKLLGKKIIKSRISRLT